MSNLENLGIVILNYNCYELTIRCASRILNFYEGSVILVIVDNNSSGNDYEMLKDRFCTCSKVVVLETGINGGYSCGNNYGFKYIVDNHPEIKYIGVMNPDVLIIDNLILKNLTQRLEEDDTLAGIAPLIIINNKLKTDRWAYKFPSYIDNFLSSLICLKWVNPSVYRSFKMNQDTMVSYVDIIPGSFFIMKKDIFERIKFFDENIFLYGEEIILGLKIKRENLRLGLSFRDYYLHAHPNSKGNLRNDILHLKYSLKSYVYINMNYRSKIWGTLDTTLLFLFLPYRMFELLIVYIHYRLKR